MRKAICLILLAVLISSNARISSCSGSDACKAARQSTIDWLLNSGVLNENNTVHEGIKCVNGTWCLSNNTRIDAQCEVALAFLYNFHLTGNQTFRAKAVALLKQAATDSNAKNGGKPWFCTASGQNSCYTQDNGRIIRCLALGYEDTGDLEIKSVLENLCSFWVGQIPSNGSLGVGINLFSGKNFLPDKYACARHIGEMLVGLIRAYEALSNSTYLEGAQKLASWLLATQKPDGHWHVPTIYEGYDPGEPDPEHPKPPPQINPLYYNGYGNEIEAVSYSLRGLSLLYGKAPSADILQACSHAYSWIKNITDTTSTLWGSLHLPSEPNRASDLRYFNAVYMQTPMGLIDYYKYCNSSEEPLELAREILLFMSSSMALPQESLPLVRGGIVGEWDLSTGSRSAYRDDEGFVWGNWIYTGWVNCEMVEACAEVELFDPVVSEPAGLIVVMAFIITAAVFYTSARWQTKEIPTTEGYATMFPTNTIMIGDYVHMAITTFPSLNEETRIDNLCNITYTRFKHPYDIFDVTHIASGTSSGAYSYFQDGILYIATWIGEHNELHIWKIESVQGLENEGGGGLLGRNMIRTK